MSEGKYIGITIGPILDTLREASSPAALWLASSFFSDLTCRLCQAICGGDGMAGAVILSPYYSDQIRTDDGVGKFHDRIILFVEQYDRQKLENIIARVRKETVQNFDYPGQTLKEEDITAFLDRYLQVHFVVLDKEQVHGNSILAISPYLDAMELIKTFQDNTMNPFRAIFAGNRSGANENLKKSPLFRPFLTAASGVENQFVGSNHAIKNIHEIASCGGWLDGKLKKSRYFAIVQADGDGMGHFLQNLNDDEVTKFSEACLNYAGEAAGLIGSFGGMTIYAGGDDLLFLAPVEDSTGKTVFGLCKSISELFEQKMADVFSENADTPTVSFGISIQYEKYPLYEALANAQKLLFGEAKNHCYQGMGKASKNSMAIEIQKHSGQTMALIVSNDDYEAFTSVMVLGSELQNGDEAVTSVLFTLQTYQYLVEVLNDEVRKGNIDKAAFETAWMNLFDNVEQKPAENYLKSVCSVWYDYILTGNSKIEALEAVKGDDPMTVLIQLLRMKKFFVERGED